MLGRRRNESVAPPVRPILEGKYFPYGQERPSATTDGKEKFATYFRDSETGLDYAQNRYHQPGMGRFMTSDAYATSDSKDPGSWNRYAYASGDPINGYDPSGNNTVCVDGPNGDGQTCHWEPDELPGTHHTPGGINADPQCMILYLAAQGGNPDAGQMFETYCIVPAPGLGGGGGGATDFSGIQRASGGPLGTSSAAALGAATTAQNAIANRKAWSGPCEQLLGAIGVTSSAISFAAANASIYDGTSGFSGDILMADLYLNTSQAASAQAQFLNMTVAQYIANQAKIGEPVKAVAGLNRNLILINPTYWGGSSANDFATVMHELIHNATGLNDTQLGSIVKGNFSDALKRDCF
jgi:RHS repeat-associated protein